VQRASEYAIQLAPDPDNLKNKPGEVFGYFAYAHPFLDGNGRTILTVYSELCRRAGFMIRWPDIQKATFLQALTKELQDPSKGHLDALVHPYIVERKLSKRKMVDHLTDNFGREN
jgi:cell filamentation protein